MIDRLRAQVKPVRIQHVALSFLLILLTACGSNQPPRVDLPTRAPVPVPAAPEPLTENPEDTEQRAALLIPMSGRAAGVAADMLNASLMAINDFGDTDLIVTPYDTRSSQEGARDAARRAISDGADIILGPLFADNVPVVAAQARAENVRLISFTNNAAVSGEGIYLLGMRPDQQVERTIAYAASRGLGTIAILGATDGFGRVATNAARRAAAETGMIVSGVASYAPRGGQTNLAIDQLNLGASKPDALLLTDSGNRLAQVMSQLDAGGYDAGATRILGTGRWLQDGTGQNLQALSGAWVSASDPDKWQNFSQRFASLFGAQPAAQVVALAYDATALAALLTSGSAAGTLNDVDIALSNGRGFAGSLGLFQFDLDGLAEHGLAIIEIDGGDGIVIDPAPNSFPPDYRTGSTGVLTN